MDPLPANLFGVKSILNSEALIAHINNPPVQAYVEKHDELADTFEIEVYGNLSEDAIDSSGSIGRYLSNILKLRLSATYKRRELLGIARDRLSQIQI